MAGSMVPEYVRRLMLAEPSMMALPGSISMVKIEHDDDCAIFSGGICACDPNITSRTEDGRVLRILSDGRVVDETAKN